LTTPLRTKDKKCPYDLSSFDSYKKSIGQKALSGVDAYIRITENKSSSSKSGYSIQPYLVVSEDVRELISCVFGDAEYFAFLVQEDAHLFAIVPSDRGTILPIVSKKAKRTRIRQMYIGRALPAIKRMFGNDISRIELSVEYYDECVVFKPTGKVVRN